MAVPADENTAVPDRRVAADRVRVTLRALVREIREDRVFDTAAGVAFWLLLSLPAALLAGLSSVALLGDDLTADLRRATLEFVDRVFAGEAASLRESIDSLFERSRPGVLSVSVAVAIFTLSRGFAGLIRALDLVYDVEDTRNFVHTRLLGMGLALGTLATVAASTALWARGGAVGVPFTIRLVGAVLVLVVWSATMYHIGPNHRTPWRFDLPGALLAGSAWLVGSLGFGWYVRLAGGSGNDVLGATGALLLGLTWMWLVCVVFLIGGELNEIIASRAGVVQQPRSITAQLRRRFDR